MDYIHVAPGTTVAEEVRELFNASFPEEERTSFDKLLELTKDEKVAFLSGYIENNLISFGFYVEETDGIYGLYFAVNPAHRREGIGTNIIKETMGEKLRRKPLFMDAEEPDEGADDSDTKVRRIKFYEKFGLRKTKYCISGRGVKYRILSTTGDADVWKYIDFLNKYCNCDAGGNTLTYAAHQDGIPEPLTRPE